MLPLQFRSIMKETISQKLDNKPIALLFSGGTDSLVILWTLIDLQATVTCYTFRLDTVNSEDTKAAHSACNIWNIPIVDVIIPYKDIDVLLTEVKQLIKEIKTARKTAIECTYPFTYIAPLVKENQVWCGLNADDLWGSAKSIIINYSDNPIAFRNKRKELLADYNTSAWGYIEQQFTKYSKHLISPYRNPLVIDYLLEFNWQELNRPRQKILAYQAFKNEFSKLSIWRKNSNLQCVSGIREYLARLLQHSNYNCTNIITLYRTILKEIELENIQPRLII